MISLDALNELPVGAFTETLGAIFEHSPWVASRAAASRPFDSRLDLLDAMRTVVRDAPIEDQLNLIRAHPQLGARGRKRQELTEASSREQRRAGLDACSDDEFAELMRLNAAYVQKFEFPFILAVRGHDPESILAFMRDRLDNTLEQERHTALTQIGLIGGYRLADTVASSPSAEVRAMYGRITAPGASASHDANASHGANVSHGANASHGVHASHDANAPLLREWMLAAGLDVRAAVGFTPIGPSTPTIQPSHGYLVFGAYFDTTTRAPHRDGSLSALLGVAIAQDLRLKQLPTRYGLLVSPFPAGGPQGSILLDAAGTIRDSIAVSVAEIDSLIPVQTAGITERCVLISASARPVYSGSSTHRDGAKAAQPDPFESLNDSTALDRTIATLEDLLTRPVISR